MNEGERSLAKHADTHDVERQICCAVDDSSVGHNLSWRTVEDYVIIVFAQIGCQRVKLLAQEQLRGIGWGLLAHDVVQVLAALTACDDTVYVGLTTQQVMNDAHAVVAVDHFRGAALAQVKVHQAGLLAKIGQRESKVHTDIRLAFARHRRDGLYNLLV